ncbi:MAG: YggS family pyridoxal phosphate enzyme [Elusimicrobia bacterium RIFCSPLOWO2_02_FULL_39_32]|nr:MAG: YggS family pyridoxal phosphate enzyme [Elusimicrobia bacterium GWA2_38_7]OGR78229.1 MAG: YggS family pyridoxal phosphate enzyme [Elusimicrobia bacterium RIFCSPHIGHO2_02_FULL_39_36]OGR92367.1 MAG: YggS family pyridoxal phosphate enzyme [Elusimicrobia bacterium RIFCSPLOWO2_02_FULL_39_32]OGR98910.1 MAG: YggS family pyridoxal phosphate enzyme [Elusimicrobia bacterium RIFCSPLOWO2_12_FULL_39_28]
MIEENLKSLLERIEKSCVRSKRKKEEIQIIAVTKRVPLQRMVEAIECGLKNFGESQVQEAKEKFESLQSSYPFLKWHMVGHLQTNKVNRAVEIFDAIQSVDSFKCMQAIDRRASQLGKVQGCLLEIKVSEEPTKFGLREDEVQKILDESSSLKHIYLKGFMCIAPYFDDPNKAKPYFSKTYDLFNRFFLKSSLKIDEPVLSMGMSHDFEAAIEEGSNMIRIGTALFGERY